jgi:2-C-methyl-D-erythritol 2,4-cyclodiphosphate synthase
LHPVVLAPSSLTNEGWLYFNWRPLFSIAPHNLVVKLNRTGAVRRLLYLAASFAVIPSDSMKIRTGFGYDVHQLQEGLPFWLGGIQVPHTHGALGHSDADVLIHVICDALLGAANLRDIGFHFPDTDPQYKGIDSKRLLAEVVRLLTERGYTISNIDSTICLEAPKVNPHIAEMQRVLSEVMGIPTNDISIKATTTEKLGFVGRREGVAAYASVLIMQP